MRIRSILLSLIILFSSSFVAIKANNRADEIVKVEDIENVNVPAPPVILIPVCPVAVAIGVDLIAIDNFCTGLVAEINDLIARNNDLKTSLNDLKTQINNAAADMLDVLSKARRVKNRINGCFGLMQRTRSCVGDGYKPDDWTDHNPNGSFTNMELARDDLLDLRSDIATLDRAADSRIRRLNDLLADADDCDSKEDANALREALVEISLATDAAYLSLATIQANAIAEINNFNAAYAEFKTKISNFLTKTQQVINENAPNSVRNIRRTCRVSRRAAYRERRRRSRVVRCLRRLRQDFNDLP